MGTVASFLAAILTPVFLLTGWYLYGQFATFESDDPYIWVRTRRFLLYCLSIATAYVVILGIPTYLLLRRFNAIRWWSTIGAGFVLGSIPVAILTWPLRYPELRTSASADGVQTMIDGTPTVAGWLQYGSAVAFFGACGTIAALAFWVAYRK